MEHVYKLELGVMKDGYISICCINVTIYYNVITMLGICFDELVNSKTLKHVMYSSVMQTVSGRNYTSVKTRLGLAPRGLSVFWLSRRLIRLPGGTF